MTTVVRQIHQSLRHQESVRSPKSVKLVGINCVSYGFISVIGKQRTMEDAVAVAPGFGVGELDTYDFFAVYDGHGGDQVANSCRNRLHRLVAEEVERVKLGRDFETRKVHWEKVMSYCFNAMDEEVAGGGGSDLDVSVAVPVEVSERTTVGSTAVVVMVGKEEIVVANCGDSRAVMSRNGVAFALSSDHKPDRPDELERIEAADGQIFNCDANDILAMLGTSRSIGDRSMRPFIIPEPEVRVFKRDERSDFIIIATDGLWDVISNEFACEVVSKCFCRQYLKNYGFSDESSGNNAAAEAAAMLAELAMARGSKDNISVTVVELKSLKSLN